ncbi:MAG: UvrD/REP helicase [Bradyrhizobium sp.]|nr:UvrD/REP helicase [Bradyrhizobium sp.]
MNTLSDAAARTRALTDFGSTLLVEAAAGTGKTSLLAGRIALLLASGVAPSAIAAITFTELAANELATRVREIVDMLLEGRIPRSLAAVLPDGLSVAQGSALRSAAENFDGLTTATIHGFCQELIRGYAVEADIDPGAQVMDKDTAELSFGQVFDAWLARRFAGQPRADDPIAVLARHDPRKATATLRELAEFKAKHRDAQAPGADLSGRPDIEFSDAIDAFRRCASTAAPHQRTAELLQDLEKLDLHYAGGFAARPDFEALWRMAAPPRQRCMRAKSFELVCPRHLSSDRDLANVAQADRALIQCFAAVDRAYRQLLGKVSTGVIAALSVELDEVLADYAGFKRSAALLDFDDLLDRAGTLLRTHEPVRLAIAARFRHLLVDEFQDTDPLQCDIIFRIVGQGAAASWHDIAPRAGALFVVGDPKQAIYQFRGAHVATYEAAKAAIGRAWPDNILTIVANFRSRKGVLAYVNSTFSDPLAATLQPGYIALEATREDDPDRPSAVRFDVIVPPRSKREEVQDAEAELVAGICARLLGAPLLGDAEGRPRAIAPRDIALLAPTRNELWRYERALQALGLPFASQAGDTLYRRQETQDLIALVRVLADSRDTLAFGALLRGPLVGLTDQAILDIAEALPEREGRPARFTVATPADQIADPIARQVVSTLAILRRRARFTSPAQLLGEAVERLGVRVALALRDPSRVSAANANVDLLLERASAYAVRGLRRLATDLSVEWQNNAPAAEGRAEPDGDTIAIVTMHSAKGLEWPIVIPINATVQVRQRGWFVHRPFDNTLHWMLGDVAPPDLAQVVQADSESQTRERARIWYVACTRARDYLIMPHLSEADARAWARILDLRTAALPALTLTAAAAIRPPDEPGIINLQDAECFAAQAAHIAASSPALNWLRPSDHDADRAQAVEVVAEDLFDDEEAWVPAGGRLRGLLLHKLIEEIIAEGFAEDTGTIVERAGVLAQQLSMPENGDDSLDDIAELAATTLRTLALPEIAALRPRLRAELPIYAMIGDERICDPMAGRADAVALADDGSIEIVIDWKSDVAPAPAQLADHVEQLRLYLAATGAPRGALVYMTLGRVRWIEAAPG